MIFTECVCIKSRGIWCLLLILWAACARAGAPAAPYQIDVWRADDGLPQGTVNSIAQTPDGYLWLGTQNGLVRFDGVAFKVFNENNTPAIKNNRIVQLFVDRQGTLWIGAEQGNLFRLQNGRFSSFAMPGRGTTFNYARTFCDDADGGLWVVSCEWQLLRLGRGGITVPSSHWNLASLRPDSVASDRAGGIWVGSESELAVWQNGNFRTVWNQTNQENFQVEFLAPSRTGGCWVAANGRLRRFDAGHWAEDRGAYGWTNLPIYDLFEDNRNRLWVATLGSGLYRYDADGKMLHLTTKDGLPTDFVRCVTQDREGNIWAGTEGGGLCRLKPATFEAVGLRQGLSSDQVMSACEAADGSYWIGMNGNGLDHLAEGKVEHYDSGRGLMNGHVWSVLQDRQGTIWAGTWGGLFKLRAGRFESVSDGDKIGGVVLALYESPADGLWLGQQAFGVLTRIAGGAVSAITIPGTSASLDVRVLTEDHHGRLWVGTENEGLYCRENGQWTHLGKKEGLKNDSVWSLYADDQDTLWIGTCGGFSRWRAGRIVTWTTQNGLINDVICQILDDRRGNLWLGSYGGVFKIRKSDVAEADVRLNEMIHCVGYEKADGLPSIECQGGFQPSGLASTDGRLWFPTSKGFAVVNPRQVVTNTVIPPVIIEDLVVDGLSQGAGIAHDGSVEAPVEIPSGKQHLDFHYTATSLTAPGKVQFKYRMEGLDTEWTAAGSRRTASFSRLPPGNYQFHVIAGNNDGVWNQQGAFLAITVLPFFWQENWFWVVSSVFLLAAIFTAVRLVVTRRLHLKLERLEREQMVERERARIARDIHDDLGASLTEISILSELAQNPGTPTMEARADLRKIAAKSKDLAQLLDEIVWAVNPRRDTLDNFISYTCTYAEDYLRLAQIQCRLELPALIPEVALRTDVRHGLFLVVKEALNNIVKHAAASEVKISMGVRARAFVICLQDNGRGFSQDRPAARDGNGLDGAGARSDGLCNMRQRMEAMGGGFGVHSRPDHGTQVRITVPVRKMTS